MKAGAPILSVVVPTRDRCASLRRTLDALGRQTAPTGSFEVVVAVAGTADDTAGMLAAYPAPYPLRVVRSAGAGAAAARNLGAGVAHGRILLFLDDDVEPGPTLVAEHLRQHESRPGSVVIGAYPPAPEPAPDLHRQAVHAWWAAEFARLARPGHVFTGRDLLAGNLSLARDTFARVGGFDPAFRVGGEDSELGARLLKAGLAFTYAPAAHAWHHMESNLQHSFERSRLEGRADVLIAARHPELRPTLRFSPARRVYVAADLLLHALAARAPAVGDRLAGSLCRSLPTLERMRLAPLWRALVAGVRRYWYWRGHEDGRRRDDAVIPGRAP